MHQRAKVSAKTTTVPAKEGINVGKTLSSFFKGLIPDSEEKIKQAREKNNHFLELLESVKSKISSRDLNKFLSKCLQGVDDLVTTSPSVVDFYSKFALSSAVKDLAAEHLALKTELRSWERELSSGAQVASYPTKDLQHRITELGKKVTHTLSECKKHQHQRVHDFSGKLKALSAEMNATTNKLNQQNNLDTTASPFLKEARQHLINHYSDRIKHIDLARENFNAAFAGNGEEKEKDARDNIEQIFGMIDAVTLHEDKNSLYETEQNKRTQVLEAELKEAHAQDNYLRQVNALWDKVHCHMLTQKIRNNNFLEAMPAESKNELQAAWEVIASMELTIHKDVLANRKNKHTSVENSKHLISKLENLEENYKQYRINYRKVEHARRLGSEVNQIVSEMIKTIDSAIKNKGLDEEAQKAWSAWRENAAIYKRGYENLNLIKPFEDNIDKISSQQAAKMAECFSAQKIDEELAKEVLGLNQKLAPAQFNQLASNHNLTTFSGRFNHAMHQLCTKLKRVFKSSDEYASTFFAAPAAVKVRHLEGQLEEAQQKASKAQKPS